MKTTITVSEARILLQKTHNGFNPRLAVKDTSGTNAFGYEFSICRQTWNSEYGYWEYDTNAPLAITTTRYEKNAKNKGGKFGAILEVFNVADVEKAIAEL